MTNYSENPGNVRVDYFKASGKWYMTESIDMSKYYDESTPVEAVRKALVDARRYLPHFTIVVLEPYHIRAYPIMLVSNQIPFAGAGAPPRDAHFSESD